jgi:hypothetical protein
MSEPDPGQDGVDHALNARLEDWKQLVLRLQAESTVGDAGIVAAILLLSEEVRLVANESTERGGDIEEIGRKIDNLARAVFQLNG